MSMKKFLLCSFFLVLAAPLFAQASFEGVIDMTTTIPMLGDQETPMTVSVKGDRLKILKDIIGMGEVSLYVDKPAGRIVAVMPALGMGTEFDLAELQKLNADSVTPIVALSGKKEKIGDYQCESFTCQLKSGVVIEIWMTKDMPNIMHRALLNSFATSLQSMRIDASPFERIMSEGYAPIRTIISKNGANKTVITLQKYEAKPIADDVVTIPADVKLQKIDPSELVPKTSDPTTR